MIYLDENSEPLKMVEHMRVQVKIPNQGRIHPARSTTINAYALKEGSSIFSTSRMNFRAISSNLFYTIEPYKTS